MIKNNLIDLLDIAKEAAEISGEWLAKHSASSVNINFESRRDVKIAADKHSEKRIIKFLQKKSDFSIISEENGTIEDKNKEYTWIVDPLDGTLNYLRGLPFCCVSVGLWKNNMPILGVVYDFDRNEIFSGITGKGAWLNGSKIRVSDIRKKDKAVLGTGFPVNTEFSVKKLSFFISNIRFYKKVRLLGSAALSIAYIASGRVDAYHEENIMFWDIGGAIPILLGAGGRLEMKKSSKINSFNVHASNGCF